MERSDSLGFGVSGFYRNIYTPTKRTSKFGASTGRGWDLLGEAHIGGAGRRAGESPSVTFQDAETERQLPSAAGSAVVCKGGRSHVVPALAT